MKKERMFQKKTRKMRDWWRNLFNHSDAKKISRGASNIDKVITTAKGDQWRGVNNKHRKPN